MKDSLLSYHLRILKGAGLVAPFGTSNYRVYRVTAYGRKVGAALRGIPPRDY